MASLKVKKEKSVYQTNVGLHEHQTKQTLRQKNLNYKNIDA